MSADTRFSPEARDSPHSGSPAVERVQLPEAGVGEFSCGFRTTQPLRPDSGPHPGTASASLLLLCSQQGPF